MPQKKTTKRTVTAKLAAAEISAEVVGETGLVSSTTNGVNSETFPQVGEKIMAATGRGRKKRKGAADDAEIENGNEQQPSTSVVAVNANNTNQTSEATNSPIPAKRGRKKVADVKNVAAKVNPKPPKVEKGRKKKVEDPPIENDDAPMEETIEEKSIPKKRGRKAAVVAAEISEELEEPLPIEEKPAPKKASKKRGAPKTVLDEPTPSPKSPKATTISKKKELKAKSSASPQKLSKTQSKKANKTDAKGKKNNAVAVDGGNTEKTNRNRKHSTDDKEEDEDSKKSSSGKEKKNPLNPVNTIYNKTDFELAKKNDSTEKNAKIFKISSWNVAGLRSWVKKDGLVFLNYEQPDIFCLQETKCTTDLMPEEAARIPGYHPYWLCKPGGYAGVAIYSKIMPINVEYGIGDPEFDDVAGRLITAEYEKFYLVCVYVPNSGRKLVNLELRMRWEAAFQKFIKNLDARKPVIICGDMNVSHQEIDLANPKSNTRSAGFTKEERDQFTKLLSLGFVDTYRHLYPDQKGAYTYWTYLKSARSRNVGWRLDYFIVSEKLMKYTVDNCIRSQVVGSDHCPITLFLKF